MNSPGRCCYLGPSNTGSAIRRQISRAITKPRRHFRALPQILRSKKRKKKSPRRGRGGSSVLHIQCEGLQAVRGPLIKKIQLFVYIHFPHSDYFINCPAFISSLPIPPNNQFFYPDQQTHHRSFVDSKDLLSLLKEPLFFDDWVAANFKAINLPSDWLAAQQSPYQILGGDPGAGRRAAEIARRGGVAQARRRGERSGSGGEAKRSGQLLAFPAAPPCLGSAPAPSPRPGRSSHGRGGRPPERLPAGFPPGQYPRLRPLPSRGSFGRAGRGRRAGPRGAPRGGGSSGAGAGAAALAAGGSGLRAAPGRGAPVPVPEPEPVRSRRLGVRCLRKVCRRCGERRGFTGARRRAGAQKVSRGAGE